jgi:hypothetical protein
VKSGKVDAVLVAVASQIEVVVERECEYRDYLVCDQFTISIAYSPVDKKRAIEEVVTFQVTGGMSSLSTNLFSCVLVIVFMLFL